MKSRCLAALAAVLLISGCGGKPAVPAQTRCVSADYTMNCALSSVGAPPVAFGLAPTVQGGDFGWGSVSASSARAWGWRFAASYLSTDPSKDWTSGLVGAYARAGIARVAVFETSAERALGGCGAGAADARLARSEASELGFGAEYFAVDFDEQPGQAPTVAAYFRCADHVLGVSHVGVYGGYWTVSRLYKAHLVHYVWQTYAWSGGRWCRCAQLEQWLNGSMFDHDRAIAVDYGQSPAPAVPSKHHPKHHPKPRPRPHHKPVNPRLRHLYSYRTHLRKVLVEQHCRVKHPDRHCRGVLRSGARVNGQIRRLGGR